jgi:hypothetical protein
MTDTPSGIPEETPGRQASRGRRRSRPGSAARWSTTTSSSTAPPRPWCSGRSSSRSPRPPPACCSRSPRSVSGTWRGPWAACSAAGRSPPRTAPYGWRSTSRTSGRTRAPRRSLAARRPEQPGHRRHRPPAERVRHRTAADPGQLLRRPGGPLRPGRRAAPHAQGARPAVRPGRARGVCSSTCTRATGRVFVEIVQRLGGYRGYGAANAPIRLATQHTART